MVAIADTHPAHDNLLRAFLDPALTLIAIADGFGLTITALLAWARSPEARTDLEAVRDIAALRAEVMAAAALPEAVDNLLRITADLAALTPDESTSITTRLRLADTARKNATAILHLAKPIGVPPFAAPSGGRRVVAGSLEAEAPSTPTRLKLTHDGPFPPSEALPTSPPPPLSIPADG